MGGGRDIAMQKNWFLFIFSLLLIGLFLFPIFHLELRDRKENRICFIERASTGDLLRFSYIHSIEKIPVEAVLRIDREGLKVIETEAPSYGAGLPNVVPNHLLKKEKGTFRIFAESEVMDPFTFFISVMTHPVLQFKGNKILLEEVIQEGGVMDLRVRQTPAFVFYYKKLTLQLNSLKKN
jgi:hypothetical protein